VKKGKGSERSETQSVEQFQQIMASLMEIIEDSTVPRNVKNKANNIINILKEEDSDVMIKVNKALNELEEISDDANMQPYTRIQILNIVSMLESIN